MKRLGCIVQIGLVLVWMCCAPAWAQATSNAPSEEIPTIPSFISIDACIFKGQPDPGARGWAAAAYRKLLKLRSPRFLSVTEVKLLEEAGDCDLAIRISQPDPPAVKADLLSAQSHELLASFEERGSFFYDPSDKIISHMLFSLRPDSSLVQRVLQERKVRLARAGDGKVGPKEETAQPQPPAPATVSTPVIASDIDELPGGKEEPNRNAYAVVIGIETYRQDLPAADFALSDARLVRDYLSRSMGYPVENIATLTNEQATKGAMEKYFERWLPDRVGKDGIVFIYYSGHGAPDPKVGDAFLVPYDGDLLFLNRTGYSLNRMRQALGKLPARQIVVALDSAFSGAGGRSVLAEGSKPLVIDLEKAFSGAGNVTVLTAASGDQNGAIYRERGHGLFTYFLLKGIKDKDVVKSDGTIAVMDLFTYLKSQVQRVSRKQFKNEQTPQMIGGRNDEKESPR